MGVLYINGEKFVLMKFNSSKRKIQSWCASARKRPHYTRCRVRKVRYAGRSGWGAFASTVKERRRKRRGR